MAHVWIPDKVQHCEAKKSDIARWRVKFEIVFPSIFSSNNSLVFIKETFKQDCQIVSKNKNAQRCIEVHAYKNDWYWNLQQYWLVVCRKTLYW